MLVGRSIPTYGSGRGTPDHRKARRCFGRGNTALTGKPLLPPSFAAHGLTLTEDIGICAPIALAGNVTHGRQQAIDWAGMGKYRTFLAADNAIRDGFTPARGPLDPNLGGHGLGFLFRMHFQQPHTRYPRRTLHMSGSARGFNFLSASVRAFGEEHSV